MNFIKQLDKISDEKSRLLLDLMVDLGFINMGLLGLSIKFMEMTGLTTDYLEYVSNTATEIILSNEDYFLKE